MATLKEAIAAILIDDSNLMGAGNLGTLLGYNATTKPNCVFYAYPPKEPVLPLITYRIAAEEGHFPRNVFLDITVWGGSFRAIADRVYDLLQKKLQVTATDWVVKGVLYESSGPELYDENLKVYFQRSRYRIVTLRA